MNIDKYKKEDGYYDEDDCFYEDAESFLQAKLLGFCGCGNPERSLKHVQTALRQVDNLNNLSLNDNQSRKNWSTEGAKLLGGEPSAWFMWYWLDCKEFTEHGGSVPGWLTAKGRELLEDLDEYFESENKP